MEDYYYIDHDNNPIYFSIIAINNAYEATVYKGDKLVIRNSFQRGTHIFKKENISLKVQTKMLKFISELQIDDAIVTPQKLKRKELRNKLQELGIVNEINPKVLPKKPFNIMDYKIPLVLLVIAIIWQVLVHGKGKFWDVPAMILFVVAYIGLFGGLIDRVPERYMDTSTRGKFKLIIGVVGMVLTQILISKLINFSK